MAATDIALAKGLPANLDAERFVLGSILLDDSAFIETAGVLEADDFSLEKHRRIFHRMSELFDRGERIDRVTVANELMRHGQLESVDGAQLPGVARRRAAAHRQPRKLCPHRQGQVPAAAHHLHVAEADRPLLHRRGRVRMRSSQAPKRICSSWVTRGRRTRWSTPTAHHSTSTKAASTLSSTPASASRG